MTAPVILTTTRLVLRPFHSSDAKTVQRLAGDRAIADTTLNIPHPYTEEDARTWIESQPESFAAGTGVSFAIEVRDGDLVGSIGLATQGAGCAELGYWIAVPHWNRGYATEAAGAVLRHAFETMGLRRVFAQHFDRNPPSGRVLEKIGMRREGVLRQHALKWDRPVDLVTYGILAEEFENWSRARAMP